MHAEVFLTRMLWLKSWFNVLPLDDAIVALARGTLPDRALAITFDDGYADNATVAMPILRQLGLHATFFIAAGFFDGARMWNDTVIDAVRAHPGQEIDLSILGLGKHAVSSVDSRRATIALVLAKIKYRPSAERQALADLIAESCAAPVAGEMMTRHQLRELAASGMGIGAHTVTHPILAELEAGVAKREIAEGRDVLEGIVRQPVTLFAYPNGKPNVDYWTTHVEMVRALGFAGAVSTAWGAARSGDSLYELPRFTPWDRTAARYGLRLARNLMLRPSRACS
jgi:peptidoglycan/xylan/chitin deacetylase (PgdA/CDA1 family)